MNDIFECRWPVSRDGYVIEIIPAVETGGLLGTSPERRVIRPLSSLEKHRHYDPMLPSPEGEPLLFRTFADLDETEDAVIDFANRFGMLTIPWNSKGNDEDINLWFDWIRAVREQIEMYEAGEYRSEDWIVPTMNYQDNIKSIQLTLRKEGKNGGMALKANLSSLRLALWAQLGLWISTPALRTHQKKCVICNRWITHGPGTGHRSRGNTCGDKPCKNAADFKKNASARKIRKEQGR